MSIFTTLLAGTGDTLSLLFKVAETELTTGSSSASTYPLSAKFEID